MFSLCMCGMKNPTMHTDLAKVLAALESRQAGWDWGTRWGTLGALSLQPNRTYYLMDPSGNAHKWCRKIQEVWRQRYQSHPDASAVQ
jgi:hypothetical protein